MTIKLRLLLTISIVILLSTAFMGFYSYHNQIRQLEENFEDLAKNENRLFETILIEDAEGLRLALSGLSRLEKLLTPLAAGQRDILLAEALPIFESLKSQHHITHMYFIKPDGTVFLRVHKPGEHGDTLERATFLQAAATRSPASGLEMGLNFFSVRCVTPVFVRGDLVGYLEVGEEIDHIFEQMKTITGNDVSVLLTEKYIRKHHSEWPRLNTAGFAILYPTRPRISLDLAKRLGGEISDGLNEFKVKMIDLGGKKYVVGLGPILDASGVTAGVLLSQHDITLRYAAIWRGMAVSLAVFLAILMIGNILLYLSLEKSLTLFQTLHRHIQGVTRTWNLESPLEVTTSDEIGELAEDLNRMQAELGKLHASLKERADELTTVNSELESFSYSLSHDLRLPLTRIYSASDMLREGYAGNLDETGNMLLAHICEGSERMEELIEAILVLASISRKDLRPEKIDLGEMARGITAELQMSETDRKLTCIIPPELIARGDPRLLKVALTNLLENAWKYTRPVPEPKIEVGKFEKQGEQVFFVRDNGVGFDMNNADDLFTPFKRLHGDSEFPGTGIGLATVQRIIKRHGGTLWAEGTRGKGAVFYFSLP